MRDAQTLVDSESDDDDAVVVEATPYEAFVNAPTHPEVAPDDLALAAAAWDAAPVSGIVSVRHDRRRTPRKPTRRRTRPQRTRLWRGNGSRVLRSFVIALAITNVILVAWIVTSQFERLFAAW